MKISLAQFEITPGDPKANLEKVRLFASAAHADGSSLLLLPELWLTGFDIKRTIQYACQEGDETLQRIAAICRSENIFLGGSILMRCGTTYQNTFHLINPDGLICASYAKTHLFQQMGENQFLTPGEAIHTVEAPFARIGMAICYDLRFPELFKIYALQGAEFILLSAEWPVERIEQWKVLIRARAIENRMFVAAVNSIGRWRDMDFGGHSALISPDGTLIAEGGNEEQFITANLDLESIEDIRKTLPFGTDRRPELYARYMNAIQGK